MNEMFEWFFMGYEVESYRVNGKQEYTWVWLRSKDRAIGGYVLVYI